MRPGEEFLHPTDDDRGRALEPSHSRGGVTDDSAVAGAAATRRGWDDGRPALRSLRGAGATPLRERNNQGLSARSVLSLACVGGLVVASMFWDGSVVRAEAGAGRTALAEGGAAGGAADPFAPMPVLKMPAMPNDFGAGEGDPAMAALPKLKPIADLEKVIELPDAGAPPSSAAHATAAQAAAADTPKGHAAAGAGPGSLKSLASTKAAGSGGSGESAGSNAAGAAPSTAAAAAAASGKTALSSKAGAAPARAAPAKAAPLAATIPVVAASRVQAGAAPEAALPVARLAPVAQLAPRKEVQSLEKQGLLEDPLQVEVPAGPRASALRSGRSKKRIPRRPLVSKLLQDRKALYKAEGGDRVTIIGHHFGNDDADREVRIGGTVAERTEWINAETIIAFTPPGVGRMLDVSVAVLDDLSPEPRVGEGKGLFAYTAPYVWEVDPRTVGHPLEGPAEVMISAWGVGLWDTHPQAKINGHECQTSEWINNQTVRCVTPTGSRIVLQNPEIVVAGQRSSCGVMFPGICTVSVHTESVGSPEKLRQEIAELKAHGRDASELEARLAQISAESEDALRNDPQHPCTSFVVCKLRTWISSLSSAFMMMVSMASICLLMIVMRPFTDWVKQEYFHEEDEFEFEEIEDHQDMLEQDFTLHIHLR